MERALVYKLILSLSIFIAIFTLLCTVFGFEGKISSKPILKGKKKEKRRIENYEKILKENRRKEILRIKPNLRERLERKVKNTIELSEIELTLEKFLVYTLISSIAGIMGGMILRNPLLMIIFGCFTAVIPFFYIQEKAKRKFKVIEENLPTSLGNIIAQFMSEEDFVIAVEKKLDQLPNPLNKYFTSFVNEVQVLNINVVEALENLKDKVDNYYFKEFIDLAIQTEVQGEELKYTMMTIPEDLRDIQQVQGEFDLIRKKYIRNFVATLIFFPLNLLILRAGYRRYYDLIVYTAQGKIGLAVVVLIMIGCTYFLYKYNKPIRVEID
jgi:tight adherence protein B